MQRYSTVASSRYTGQIEDIDDTDIDVCLGLGPSISPLFFQACLENMYLRHARVKCGKGEYGGKYEDIWDTF